MGEVSTIGLDIAKSVFQVHGADVDGAVVIRKRVSRAKVLEFFSTLPACVVGIEACPSAHHWSRELRAVCTENLSPEVVVMESAEDGARLYASGSLNRARNRRILVQRQMSVRASLYNEV